MVGQLVVDRSPEVLEHLLVVLGLPQITMRGAWGGRIKRRTS